MSKRYYIVDIIGDGTEYNPYRPALDGLFVAWSGSIPSDPETGIPLYQNALVMVATANHGELKHKPGIAELPDFPMLGKMSAMQVNAKSALTNMLNNKGFNTNTINAADGYIDLLDSVGKQRDPAFKIAELDVTE